ncbi:hypothetical protein [Luteibacter yeojuensis]|uniref:Uncharacterized protein n=1 Tax=Luteibacter yeojuensis TaxID=345309 RepID=A0A0F3K5C2_9GAMM|nr:hypothetical protein [Luteibacter yeojuensis]KJV26381.1 hypothetical protein VI08_18790 [Luteibacter yeojuensis]
MSTRRILIATAIALAACGGAHAADFPVNHAVPDERLDAIRGGFDMGSFQASLGLERTVMINGVEAIRQTVNIPDVTKITADQATAMQAFMGTTFVANGNTGAATSAQAPGLSSVTLPTSVSPGLVVQNALDNQAISATTKIDASVNTSQMLQGLRIDEAIRDTTIQFRGN